MNEPNLPDTINESNAVYAIYVSHLARVASCLAFIFYLLYESVPKEKEIVGSLDIPIEVKFVAPSDILVIYTSYITSFVAISLISYVLFLFYVKNRLLAVLATSIADAILVVFTICVAITWCDHLHDNVVSIYLWLHAEWNIK